MCYPIFPPVVGNSIQGYISSYNLVIFNYFPPRYTYMPFTWLAYSHVSVWTSKQLLTENQESRSIFSHLRKYIRMQVSEHNYKDNQKITDLRIIIISSQSFKGANETMKHLAWCLVHSRYSVICSYFVLLN